ncbi:Flp pilus assembly complex ATPase component TadA [Acidithiobacillus ferrivorans]|nr:Flp pilus assembly complex ATPase component TadA [Acidithiobacillus ferrivorans]
MQFLDTLLQALSAKGSDLYLSVGSPPMMKIQGRMTAIGTNKLKSPTCLEIATTLLGPDGVCHFQSDKSANFAHLVNQREVGIDAVSYQDALENALRQAPDVILMGEVRARETMDHAVAFAETGHLCLSTLHANNANQAIDRVINFFPADRRNQLLMDLSLNVKAIISQRLLRTLDGGRAAAVEVLINTPRVSDLMLNGEIHLMKETMEKGAEYGMRTFDQALLDMVMDGRIDVETALQNADSQNNLRLMIREQHHSNGTSGPNGAAWEIK